MTANLFLSGIFSGLCLLLSGCTQAGLSSPVSQKEMALVYEQVKTPVKRGLVVTPDNPGHKSDSPSVFRYRGKWFMSWIVFDGRGYESWLRCPAGYGLGWQLCTEEIQRTLLDELLGRMQSRL